MLKTDSTALLIVDIQGKLAQLMHEKDLLFENVKKLIRGIQALQIPIIWMEQIPKKLGPTVPEIANLLTGLAPIAKTSFSCCGNDGFLKVLEKLNRRQILVAGIETHICVYQTIEDMVDMGYEVEVVADAVSSRTLSNKKIGLEKIRDCGAALTSVETALFEMMVAAEGEAFKKIVNIVK